MDALFRCGWMDKLSRGNLMVALDRGGWTDRLIRGV